jgi:hypothetical protein
MSQPKEQGECEACQDVFHNVFGTDVTKLNYVGDIFVGIEALLLASLLWYKRIDAELAKKVGLIALCLFLIRYFIQRLTNCRANVNVQRPLLSSSDRWYILSGHTIAASLMAYLIIQAPNVPGLAKGLAGLLAVGTVTASIITREHYTVDIILTFIIVYLAVKVYAPAS